MPHRGREILLCVPPIRGFLLAAFVISTGCGVNEPLYRPEAADASTASNDAGCGNQSDERTDGICTTCSEPCSSAEICLDGSCHPNDSIPADLIDYAFAEVHCSQIFDCCDAAASRPAGRSRGTGRSSSSSRGSGRRRRGRPGSPSRRGCPAPARRPDVR